MGTLLASALVSRVRETLVDPTSKHWTDAGLLGALNDSIALAVGSVPTLNVVSGELTLVAGVNQTLAAGGLMLVDIHGTEVGGTVEQVAVSELARVHPDWRALAAGRTRYFMHDRRAPKLFQVYPQATAGHKLHGTWCQLPAAVSSGTAIPVDDWLATPLWSLMLGIAYAANTQRQDLAKATGYTTQGMQLLAGAAKLPELGPVPDLKGVH